MYKRLLWLAALLVVMVMIAFAPRFLLVPWVAKGLEQLAVDEFQAQRAAVKLGGSGWPLLMGYIPELEIHMEQAEVSGFPVAEANLKAQGMRFHPWALFREQVFAYAGSQSLQLSARVSAAGLGEYFREHVPNARELQVEVREGQLVLKASVNVLGVPWQMALTGVIQVVEPTVLEFVPVGLQLEESAAPPVLVELLQEYFRFRVDLDAFLFPIRIVRAEVGDEGILLVVEEAVE